MQPTRDREENRMTDYESKRVPYQAPAIVYEGIISIRAGSPVNVGPPSVPGQPSFPYDDPSAQ